MGVEWSVWRRWSIDIPEDFVVVSEVFMVLMCFYEAIRLRVKR